MAAMIIPLHSPQGWEVLAFRKVPAHQVEFKEQGLFIKVKASAGPLVFPLPQVTSVTKVRAKGRRKGDFVIPTHLKQGQKSADDYTLRLGLVVKGDKKLNYLQKMIAPSWVRKLHELAPANMGIDRIEFFNVAENAGHLRQRRQHPLSELLYETEVSVMGSDGQFTLDHQLPQTLEVVALWISVDGDDLKNNFDLYLEELTLN